MKIQVNGRTEEVCNGDTILSYLQSKGYSPSRFIVEYNSDIPDKKSWGDIILNENDRIEIVKIITGG